MVPKAQENSIQSTDLSLRSPDVFIVSSGRSGTTLLRALLNASQQIYIPHESDFIARGYRFYQGKQSFSDQDYKKITNLFQETSRMNGWGMPREYLLTQLMMLRPQSFADVNRVICHAYHQFEGTETLQWGIKAPVLIASVPEILDVFPTTKVIHLVRDGRDVYLSYKRIHETSKVKFGPKSLAANALYWVDGLRRIAEVQREQIYEFRYEDMLKNPEQELSKLCDFIGIKYQPSMHEDYHKLEKNQKLVAAKFMADFHAKAKGGLDPNNTEKFRQEMSQLERLIFEFLAAPFLQKYCYSLEFEVWQAPIWQVLRQPLYYLARQFNDWRYRQRDFQALQKADSKT